MTGRQVIPVKQAFTLQELAAFMEEHWDKAAYSDFKVGRPTPGSIEEFIVLPATDQHCVIAFSRKPGLFSRKSRVVLSVCQPLEGAARALARSIPTGSNVVLGAVKIGEVRTAEQDRKGPAEQILLRYTAHMKDLLTKAGLTAE